MTSVPHVVRVVIFGASDAKAQLRAWVKVCERLTASAETARAQGASAETLHALAKAGRVAAKACKAWDDRVRQLKEVES